MTIRKLFEYMRKLPDWDREVKVELLETNIQWGTVIRLNSRAGVGDFTGDLYLSGYMDLDRAEEHVDEI